MRCRPSLVATSRHLRSPARWADSTLAKASSLMLTSCANTPTTCAAQTEKFVMMMADVFANVSEGLEANTQRAPCRLFFSLPFPSSLLSLFLSLS